MSFQSECAVYRLSMLLCVRILCYAMIACCRMPWTCSCVVALIGLNLGVFAAWYVASWKGNARLLSFMYVRMPVHISSFPLLHTHMPSPLSTRTHLHAPARKILACRRVCVLGYAPAMLSCLHFAHANVVRRTKHFTASIPKVWREKRVYLWLTSMFRCVASNVVVQLCSCCCCVGCASLYVRSFVRSFVRLVYARVNACMCECFCVVMWSLGIFSLTCMSFTTFQG
jgi:hypothetical protein